MIATSKKSGSGELAWWAVLGTALVTIAYLLLLHREPAADGTLTYPFRTIFLRILDGRTAGQGWLDMAIVKTATVVLSAIALAIAIGVVVGSAQCSHNTVLRFLGACYVEALRGIPMYVMLLFVYFGIRGYIAVNIGDEVYRLNAFWSAVLALGVCSGAYVAEVIRAGILSIPHEEIEAASLEAGKLQVLRYVVMPQAVRTILPALANECIALLKDSALVSAITIMEITRAADVYARSTFVYFQTFSALALVYLVLTLLLSRVQRSLEFHFGDSRAHKY